MLHTQSMGPLAAAPDQCLSQSCASLWLAFAPEEELIHFHRALIYTVSTLDDSTLPSQQGQSSSSSSLCSLLEQLFMTQVKLDVPAGAPGAEPHMQQMAEDAAELVAERNLKHLTALGLQRCPVSTLPCLPQSPKAERPSGTNNDDTVHHNVFYDNCLATCDSRALMTMLGIICSIGKGCHRRPPHCCGSANCRKTSGPR